MARGGHGSFGSCATLVAEPFLTVVVWSVGQNFFDKLKSVTAGYATFDYEPADFEVSNIVKVDMLLNGKAVDTLSFVTHKDRAESEGRRVAQRLQAVIRRQQFEIVIQAAIGRKAR